MNTERERDREKKDVCLPMTTS